MQMTTKGRFAIVAMIDLATRPASQPVSLSAISLRRKISLSYLEQLFGKMRRGGLVRSIRGPGGGYVLALPAESITAADIVVAVDDASVVREEDMDASLAQPGTRCDTSDLWRDVNAHMIELLGAIKLSELAAEQPAEATPASAPPSRRGISSEPALKPVRTSAPNSVFALGAASAGRDGQHAARPRR